MSTAEIVLSLAVVAALYTGASWARARRALADLRKTREAIPDLRQALYLDGRRIVLIVAAADPPNCCAAYSPPVPWPTGNMTGPANALGSNARSPYRRAGFSASTR